MQQLADLLFHRIRNPVMIEQHAMVDRFAIMADQFAGDADDRAIFRNLMEHDRIGADHGIVAHSEGAKQFGPGSDQDIVPQRR